MQELSVFSKSIQADFRKALTCAAEHSIWDLELGTQRSQAQASSSPANTRVSSDVNSELAKKGVFHTPFIFTLERLREHSETYEHKNTLVKIRKIFKPQTWVIRATRLPKIPTQDNHLYGACKPPACYQTHSTQERRFRVSRT